MIIIWKVETIYIPVSLYQLESIIIIIDALLSCACNSILQNCDIFSNTCISNNLYFKCILKHVIIQYYVMRSKNFLLLIIDFNNIYGFNILRYILWILSKKWQVCSIVIFYHAYVLDEVNKRLERGCHFYIVGLQG
jgi:hypothetical protein